MDDLYAVIDNVNKDNSFEVLEVLKESRFEKTEKVRALNGRDYVRKYFFQGGSYSKEKMDAISRLAHPNLPNTHDRYELAGSSVIIQDYIHGRSLSRLIGGENLDIQTIVEISMAICRAVEYMHAQVPNPLIHRDIKPDNIIVEDNGNVKLVDFGAIREFKKDTSKDTIYIGTPGYASPEQFGFGQTDRRTDIYAIGMTMKHMLTGKPPERDGKDREPVAGNGLTDIIDKATQFDPDKRYENAGELRKALMEYSQPTQGRPTISQEASTPKSATQKKSNKPRVFKNSKIYPNGLRKGLVPVHVLIIIFLLYAPFNNILNPSGFGMEDDLIATLENIVLAVALACCYIMGFNLFNINERFKFFHKNRLGKKIIIAFLLFTLAGIAFLYMEPLHSDAYNLANSATS